MNKSALHLRYAVLAAAGFLAAGLPAAETSAPVAAPAAPEAPVASFAPKAPASTALRDTYKGIFHMGVAIRADQINGENPKAAALITRDFDCITAENAMKMGPIHPRPGNDPTSYEFGPADQIVDFGVKNHLVVIGHNLCWHTQMPEWMGQPDPGQETLTKEVLMQRLRDHIMTVAGRYKGKVHGWDVVNEAINDGSGTYRESVFYKVIGKEYIAWAFKWAHEADPAAELYYNDYNLDASDAKRAATIELVKYLKEQGAPITGIGMQGHYNLNTPSAEKIDETIGMFAKLGMKVMITELDVQVVRNAPVTGAVGANPGGPRGFRALPTLDVLKEKLSLTPEQAAKIGPILEAGTKDLTALAPGERAKVFQIRKAAFDAIGRLLTAEQQKPFLLINPPPGAGQPVGPPPPPLTAEQQQALSKRYGEIFAVFLKHRDAVTRVTFWGLRDGDSWRRYSSPLIFDDAYGRKPAYDAVINAVAQTGK